MSFFFRLLSCLGSVYAALRNWPLSISFHEQHVAMATAGKDKKLTALAHEMAGDTLVLKEDYQYASLFYSGIMMFKNKKISQ